VDADAWYFEDLQKAVYMGTMKLDTYMRPNDSITRQEAFTILARAFKMTDGTVDDLSGFADNNLVAGWAVPGVGALVKNGYVKGDGNLLAPEDNITRAQFAVVMDNMIKQYITRAGIVTSVVPGNVMVNVPGVTLKDATVSGDLIIGDGVGDEDVILENVTVTGNLVVRGGGENSVIIKGGGVGGKVVVAKVDGKVRVSVEEGADIEVVVINDGKDDVIIEGTIGMVEVAAPEVPVVVQNGTVGKIEVTGEGGASITVAGDAAADQCPSCGISLNTPEAAPATEVVDMQQKIITIVIENASTLFILMIFPSLSYLQCAKSIRTFFCPSEAIKPTSELLNILKGQSLKNPVLRTDTSLRP
jgi:hypothetical protein